MILVDRVRALVAQQTTGVYFVGYPKTGNTWTRFLLGRYLEARHGLGEPPLFDGYDRWGRCQRVEGAPGMHFTHQPLEWTAQAAADLRPDNVVEPFRHGRVALIVRYPLDVLVSMWMQQRHRTAEGYPGDLLAFAEDPVFGLGKLLRFHQLWADEHDRGHPRGLLLIRYEDLRADAGAVLTRLLDFAGVPVDETIVAHAVERSSFQSMRRLELSGSAPRYRSSGAGVFATGDVREPNALHVRKGTVGGYRDELDPGAAAALEQRIGAEMPAWYGYGAPPARDGDVA